MSHTSRHFYGYVNARKGWLLSKKDPVKHDLRLEIVLDYIHCGVLQVMQWKKPTDKQGKVIKKEENSFYFRSRGL